MHCCSNRVARLLPHLIAAATLVGLISIESDASWPGAKRSLSQKLREGPGLSNHPVGMIPSSAVSIPKHWPLNPDGTVGCMTCHDSLPSLEGGGPVNLRDYSEQDTSWFCVKCHSNTGNRGGASMHWMVQGQAHVIPSKNARSSRMSGLLDSESRKCLDCHDGVTASEATNHAGGSSFTASFADKQRNHPIGMLYPRTNVGKSAVRVRPASLLPTAVRLPDGKVSCVSCHDLYAGTTNLLSVPMEGSGLCMTCHDME